MASGRSALRGLEHPGTAGDGISEQFGQQKDTLAVEAHGSEHNGLVVGGLLANRASRLRAGPLLELAETTQCGVKGVRVAAERVGNAFSQQSRLANVIGHDQVVDPAGLTRNRRHSFSIRTGCVLC